MNVFAAPRSSLITHRSSFAQKKTAARSRGRERTTSASALSTVFVFEVVAHAEARASRRIHLLGGVDRRLELGDAVLHLGQLFLDLVLEIVDLLLRHLKRGLVELTLL